MTTRHRGLDWLAQRRGLRRWRRAVHSVGDMDPVTLRTARTEAQHLRHQLNEFICKADDHLARPSIGSSTLLKPHGTDWAWRPQVWRQRLDVPGHASVQSPTRIGEDVTLFHDCNRSELTLRQIRNTRKADMSSFGLCLDVFAFDGSFLSLAVDLPQGAVDGLTKRHLIRAEPVIEMETPRAVFMRLNVQHGPNTEQVVREIPPQKTNRMMEFDLAYTRINEKRIAKAWVDIIFDNPQMNQIVLRDVTCARRLRAEV